MQIRVRICLLFPQSMKLELSPNNKCDSRALVLLISVEMIF